MLSELGDSNGTAMEQQWNSNGTAMEQQWNSNGTAIEQENKKIRGRWKIQEN
ncbi:hypothetical protein [Methanosarcina sp. MTP4]|uniref:hypothetical protein n=1 Tax=Methanosarcina sp. MTP4 TaxID=1434100 RepID=UPI000AC6FF0D|nr:hypothetical protein [Methanosarcina sp. MTP4]